MTPSLRTLALKLPTTWMLAVTSLAVVLVIDDWFQAATYARLLIVSAAASLIAMMIHRSKRMQRIAGSPPLSKSTESTGYSPGRAPASELELAIEHMQSIRVLLQVSASHNQPIPSAVLVNLDLVLKNLRRLHGAFPSTHDESATIPNFVQPVSTPAAQT